MQQLYDEFHEIEKVQKLNENCHRQVKNCPVLYCTVVNAEFFINCFVSEEQCCGAGAGAGTFWSEPEPV